MQLAEQIQAAVEASYAGYVASAVKRGRFPQWPYVPVAIIDWVDAGVPQRRTQNPCKRTAFATREEAVAYTQKWIDANKAHMAAQLAKPGRSAWRKQLGLPEVV